MSKPLQVDNSLSHLFTNNRQWAQKTTQNEPSFFSKLAEQQSPEYLWIGCADSRVPANELIGLQPGEVFVHRNIANIIGPSDLNCLSVLQYAVDVLKVKHVIICGHYGCGGVAAAFHNRRVGLVDNWLRHIHDTKAKYHALLSTTDEKANLDRLCELNAIEQVANVSHTAIVQNAWHRGQKLSIYGCVYGIKDGLWKNLNVTIRGIDQVPEQYRLRKRD